MTDSTTTSTAADVDLDTAVVQISAIVREGLRTLHGEHIGPELTKKVIANAVKMALHSNVPGNPEIYMHGARDYTKHAEYAILALFFVAVRHGWSPDRLRSVLRRPPALALAEPAIDDLCQAFGQHGAELRRLAASGAGGAGHALPHLTDVEWKLTCAVRSSQLGAELLNGGGASASPADADASDGGADGASGGGALSYTISLGRYAAGGERESITTFQCTVEELQALVARLKEVERHCDRLARSAVAK